MQAIVNNTKVDIEKIGYNSGLNFGRFKKKDTVVNFVLTVGKNQFIGAIGKLYETTKAEVKADDIKYKESSDFKEVNYCSLSELLEKPDYLTSIFDTYLRNDFFEAVFDAESDNKYVINEIESLHFDKNIIILGKAYVIK